MKKSQKIYVCDVHNDYVQVWWRYSFCGSGAMFQVCNVNLPCDQTEGNWVIGPYFVWLKVSEALFWVSEGYIGWVRHYFGWV